MQHLDEGTIHAWIDGELPPDEASRVEAHASVCAACSALVAEARGLVAASSRIVSALDVVPSGVLPAFGAKKPPRRWMLTKVTTAIAATLVIAAGTLVTMRGHVEAPTSLSTKPVASSAEITPARQLDSAAPVIVNAPIAKLGEPAPSSVANSASGRAERRAAQAPLAAHNDNPVASAATAVTPSAPPAAADVSAPRINAQPQRAAMVGKAAAAPPTAGAAAGAASVARTTAPAPKAMVMRRDVQQLSEVVVTSATEPRSPVVRCYELDESTDILPKRFALRSDSTEGNEVRYVDSTGAIDGKIFDARWTEAQGRVSISTTGRGVVLTLTRLGLGDFQAQSPLGPRSAKVATCR